MKVNKVNSPSTTKYFGNLGEKLISRLMGGTMEGDHRPMFDVANNGYLYEVKTRYSFNKDLQIHIRRKDWANKMKYIAKTGMEAFMLMVVVNEYHICDIYISEMALHRRPTQMILLFKGISLT